MMKVMRLINCTTALLYTRRRVRKMYGDSWREIYSQLDFDAGEVIDEDTYNAMSDDDFKEAIQNHFGSNCILSEEDEE